MDKTILWQVIVFMGLLYSKSWRMGWLSGFPKLNSILKGSTNKIDSGKTPNSSPHLEVLIMMDRGIARIFQRQVILCQIEGNHQIVMSTYMLCFT